MKHIKNFVGSNPIEIVTISTPSLGILVALTQNIGSCSFQHSMTPAQCIELADMLIEVAAPLIKKAASDAV